MPKITVTLNMLFDPMEYLQLSITPDEAVILVDALKYYLQESETNMVPEALAKGMSLAGGRTNARRRAAAVYVKTFEWIMEIAARNPLLMQVLKSGAFPEEPPTEEKP